MRVVPRRTAVFVVPGLMMCIAGLGAQMQAPSAPLAAAVRVPAVGAAVAPGVPLPPDYVIGPDDLLTVVFLREKDLSAEVIVRPDGKISLPLLNDVQAAGLTPDELRLRLEERAAKFVQDANATVMVRATNSRRVFVVGAVVRPGPYPLTTATTVLQIIAVAGGFQEYAKPSDVVLMRTDNGRTTSFRFNYKDIVKGKNLRQNIELKPGDTIVVP